MMSGDKLMPIWWSGTVVLFSDVGTLFGGLVVGCIAVRVLTCRYFNLMFLYFHVFIYVLL